MAAGLRKLSAWRWWWRTVPRRIAAATRPASCDVPVKLNPPTTTYCTCLTDLFRRIGQEKMLHAPFAERLPQRKIGVVLRADEADGFDFRRQQRADAGERVGAPGINRINFQRAGNQALVGMFGIAVWIKWFWPATADGPATKSKRQMPEPKRRRPARATSGGG